MNASNALDVSAPLPPSAAVSLEPPRRLLQRLFERLVPFIADVPNANERANASVKSLEILRLESRFLPTATFDLSEPSVAAWRRRVETALDAVCRDLSAVESRSERAYLRRLALVAALDLNACAEPLFVKRFADALLAEIDDSDERQNALVAYATRLAARISRFPKVAPAERAQAFAALDEIEDLRLFERAAADVVAGVVFNATKSNALSNVASNDDATLDLTPFGDDVAEAWEQFESPGGFLELCERANAETFALSTLAPPTPQEIALRQAFSAETRRRCESLLTSLDSGVDVDGSPLSEDDRAELQSVVDEAVIASPFALEHGEFFRAFLERSRNLGAFAPIFERLSEAENATAATERNEARSPLSESAISYYRSFYRQKCEFWAEEKTRWLESARRVATRSLTFEGDLRVKLDRLTTSAELEFRFGDKTNGKNAVREVLGLLPRLESPFERARLYRRLVAAHLCASYPKAAQKLASLWKAELDAIEPEDLRDAAFVDALDLYSQAVKADETALATFVESISAPLARLDAETRLRLARLFSQETAFDASSLSEDLLNLIESTITQLQTFDETSPDEAVFALVKIATAIADRFVDALFNG